MVRHPKISWSDDLDASEKFKQLTKNAEWYARAET